MPFSTRVRLRSTSASPGLASTASNLFVRSHTFNKNQDRKGGPLASGEPVYYFKQ